MESPPSVEVTSDLSPPKIDVFQEIEDDIDHVMQKIESQQKKNVELQQRVYFFLPPIFLRQIFHNFLLPTTETFF